MIDGKYEIYRVVLDYEGLHEAIIDRVEDINVTRMSIDEVGGFAPGYAAKVLCNPPMKILGRDSVGRDGLGKMLKASGLALIVVVDDERFAVVKGDHTLRKHKRRQPPNGSMARPHWLISRDSSANMQKMRNEKLSPKQRKAIARKAAKARWKRRGRLADPHAQV